MERINKLITSYTKQLDKQRDKRDKRTTIKTDKIIKQKNIINNWFTNILSALI